MILDEVEVLERLESPANLLNRLRRISEPVQPVSIPPSADNVIEDLEEKLKYGSVKSKATAIMNAAMDELRIRIPEVSKPEKLASIAAEMSKVVNATQIRNENDVKIGQIIVYAPQVITEDRFEVIRLNEI